jgi:hypothetical protein
MLTGPMVGEADMSLLAVAVALLLRRDRDDTGGVLDRRSLWPGWRGWAGPRCRDPRPQALQAGAV